MKEIVYTPHNTQSVLTDFDIGDVLNNTRSTSVLGRTALSNTEIRPYQNIYSNTPSSETIEVSEKAEETPVETRTIQTVSQSKPQGGRKENVSAVLQGVLDIFDKYGLTYNVTSGHRPGAKTKQGKQSFHATGSAMDITPRGMTYEDWKERIRNTPEIQEYFRTHGLGILDETTSEMLQRTGGTGAHWHIGPDQIAQKTFKEWYGKKGGKIPMFQRGARMGIYEEPRMAQDATRVHRTDPEMMRQVQANKERIRRQEQEKKEQQRQAVQPVFRQDNKNSYERQKNREYTERRVAEKKRDDMLYNNQHVWRIDPTRRNITREQVPSEYQYNQNLVKNTIEVATGELAGFGIAAGINRLRNVRAINKALKAAKLPDNIPTPYEHIRGNQRPPAARISDAERAGIPKGQRNQPVKTPEEWVSYNDLKRKGFDQFVADDYDVMNIYRNESKRFHPWEHSFDPSMADDLERLVVGGKGNKGIVTREINSYDSGFDALANLKVGDVYTPNGNLSWTHHPSPIEPGKFGNNKLRTFFDERLSTLPTEHYRMGSPHVIETELVLPRNLQYKIQRITPNQNGGNDYLMKILNPYKQGGKIKDIRKLQPGGSITYQTYKQKNAKNPNKFSVPLGGAGQISQGYVPQYNVSQPNSQYIPDNYVEKGEIQDKKSEVFDEIKQRINAKGQNWTDKEISTLINTFDGHDFELNHIVDLMESESGFDPTAKNKSSTATGLFQFIQSTAKDVLGEEIAKQYANNSRSILDQIQDGKTMIDRINNNITSERDKLTFGRLKVNMLSPNHPLNMIIPDSVWNKSLSQSIMKELKRGKSTYRDLMELFDSGFKN